jgi:hypothetical protein
VEWLPQHLTDVEDAGAFKWTQTLDSQQGFGAWRFNSDHTGRRSINIEHYYDYRYNIQFMRLTSGFQLTCEIIDLFFAGTETTSTTLRWAIYYMAKYPEIQECVQNEIDAQIGSDRLPSMKDKLLLPYTEAVLNEVCGI